MSIQSRYHGACFFVPRCPIHRSRLFIRSALNTATMNEERYKLKALAFFGELWYNSMDIYSYGGNCYGK